MQGADSTHPKALLKFGEKSLIAFQIQKMLEIFHNNIFIACKEMQEHALREILMRDFGDSCDLRESDKFKDSRDSIDSRDFKDSRESKIKFLIESNQNFAPIFGIINAFEKLYSRKNPHESQKDSRHDSRDSRQNTRIFFLPCDCPFIAQSTIESLIKNAKNYDIVFARDEARIHPLISVWSAKTLPLLKQSTQNGAFRISDIIQSTAHKAILGKNCEFSNINTQDDYNRAIVRLKERANAR